jgi:hypothetical protein
VIVCIFYYDEIKLNLFDPIYKRLSKGWFIIVIA